MTWGTPCARAALLAALALGVLRATPAAAQGEFANTDANRPVATEDAYAVPRNALDLHLAPVRLEWSGRGGDAWALTPEAAYGILPRTQVELGVPLASTDVASARRRSGVAGLDVSVLYNLNSETTTWPALAVRASVLLPVGPLAPARAYPSVKGIITRSLGAARIHLNGAYTAGAALAPEADAALPAAVRPLSRWFAGAAVDRVLPLRSLLITGELTARQPLGRGTDVQWETAAGVRYQLDPRLVLDAGLGRRFTGARQPWFVAAGIAYVVGLPSLISAGP